MLLARDLCVDKIENHSASLRLLTDDYKVWTAENNGHRASLGPTFSFPE